MVRLIILFLLLPVLLAAENWPQWRGPSGDGISSETNLAVRWSADSANVAWKAPLKGQGTSTPIVWGDRIFLTSQLGDGPLAQGARDFEDTSAPKTTGSDTGTRFLVQAFARADGRLLWERSFAAGERLPEVHIKHNLASPSCVSDGERVYAWFGTGLVVALTHGGDVAWSRDLGEESSRFDIRWGHGSSPSLYDESLLLLVDHPGDSYLLAVDKSSGKDIWRTERGTEKRSYTTPFVVRREGGDQLIVNTSDHIDALDPRTGRLLWQVGEPNRVPVSTPVYHDGTLYSSRGYNSGPYLAIRFDSGEQPELKWRVPTGAPYVSSLLYYRGLIFMATESGIAGAVDAETGKNVWKHRLGGVFSASPAAADGKVYFLAESGKTHVVEASREFEIIAENDLGERTLASPAISDGTIFVRTDEHLFAIGR